MNFSSLKGKRSLISTNDLPFPVSVKRKTGNAPTAKKTTSTPKKKENPTSDALLLAFEDQAPAPITSPFSVDSPRASAFDYEPPADLPGFLSDSRVNVVSSRIVSVPLPFPDSDNVNDDDVLTISTTMFSSMSRWPSTLPNGLHVLLALLTLNHPRLRS